MAQISSIEVSQSVRTALSSTADEDARIAAIRDAFTGLYGTQAEHVAVAGGRVNLIGEHVDYPDVQFSLTEPCHLYSMGGSVQNTFVASLVRRSDSRISIAHLDAAERFDCDVSDLETLEQRARQEREGRLSTEQRQLPVWVNHTLGVLILAQRSGVTLSGLEMLLTSNVPYGAGMSNSAANCVAVSLILNATYTELELKEDIALVTFARKAENSDFAGGRCGWLDQLLIVCSRSNTLTMIDYAGNKTEHFDSKLPPHMQVIAINTSVPHVLAESEYNHRVMELELAFCTLSAVLGRDVGSTTLSLQSLNALLAAVDQSIAPVDISQLMSDLGGNDSGAPLSDSDIAAVLESVDTDYRKPDTFRHADLDARQSFAVLLRRMRHQKVSSILVPLAGAAARGGDAATFGRLINTEGDSLRMSGDFQITGDNGAQDALLDIGFGEATKLGLETYGRMLGGGGGGNVLFYVNRTDENNYASWRDAVVAAYNNWAACELKDDTVKATIIEPVMSAGARLL